MIVFLISHSESPTGGNFVENFGNFDTHLWFQDFGLICEPLLNYALIFRFLPDFQCMFADPAMVNIMTNQNLFPDVRVPFELQISAENTCTGRHCCKEKESPKHFIGEILCTEFNTGQLMSKLTFLYGTISFHGVAAKNRDGNFLNN